MKKKILQIMLGMFVIVMLSSLSSATPFLDCGDYGIFTKLELNEGSGNMSYDSCGLNNLSIVGAEWDVGGFHNYSSNYSLDFDGVNDYVFLNDSSSLNFTDNVTIMFWFYPHVFGTTDVLLEKDNAYRVDFPSTNPDRIRTSYYRSGWKDTTMAEDGISIDEWHFIAITYNMSEPEIVNIYLDGVLNFSKSGYTGTGVFDTSAEDLYFASSGGSAKYFNGKLDQIMFAEGILNATDIFDIYNRSFICNPNWIQFNTSCGFYNGTWDKFQTYYLDSNNCGVNTSLPADNGTLWDCDYCIPAFNCLAYNQSCGDTPPQPEIIYCIEGNLTNNATCCGVTGLASDCNVSGNLSQFDKLCGDIQVILQVPSSYPYIDLGENFDLLLYLYQNNVSKNLSDFGMVFNNNASQIFNFTWDDSNERYKLTLNISESGNFPFEIFAYYPYDEIKNLTGLFKVRTPFWVTFKLFEVKDTDLDAYENDFGFIFLEFVETRQFGYDTTIETFFMPLLFKQHFNTTVFHGEYEDGEAIIKLWENRTYIVRFIDGEMTFDGVYSNPVISKTYGTNMYLGEFVLNNATNQSFDIYVQEKEIETYTWLFNWIVIIGIVLALVSAVFLFFVVPQMPSLSIIFGLGTTTGLILLRITVFLWKGW